MPQRRLALLVEQKRLIAEGQGKGRHYRVPPSPQPSKVVWSHGVIEARGEVYVPISPEPGVVKQAVRAPIRERQPVGYPRAFLDDYRPNVAGVPTYRLAIPSRRTDRDRPPFRCSPWSDPRVFRRRSVGEMNMRCLIAVSALAALAGGCTATTAVDAIDDPFQRYEVVTAPAKHQTLLFGSFGGSGLMVPAAVVRVDVTERRHVHLLAFDGGSWMEKANLALEPGVLFVDVARIDGGDRLVTYRSTGVHWLDLDTGAEHPLVDATTDFHASEDAGIPHLDVMRDLNGDGRDDLCLPDTDGFWIALQSSDGSFADAVKIGVPEPFLDARAYGDKRTYGDVGITPQNTPWYLRRAHRLDFDRDGRQDLAFWNSDHFLIYLQDAAGEYSGPPVKFGTDVQFDFDGPYALAFQYGDTGVASMLLGLAGRRKMTILHGFQDLDADGIADLVTLSLAGRSPLRLGGRYHVHFGRPAPGGTSFPAQPDTSAAAPGRSAGGTAWGYASQMFLDFNNDGAVDMGLGAVNTSLGGMVRAIAANSISMELALYGLRDRRYPARPDWTRTVRTRFAPLDRRGPMFPTVLVGDVNGDGRSDLLTGERWDEVNVFLGTPGKDPVSTRPVRVAVDVPGNERDARLADLDKDGREDLVIQHPSATGPGRISILMARWTP